MSVFKFHQALAVADYLDRNGLTPDTEIFIPEEELVPDTYSPSGTNFPKAVSRYPSAACWSTACN